MTVGLAVLIVVVASLWVLAAPQPSNAHTVVKWFTYEVTGGPGTSNRTNIPAGTFCAPTNATSVPVFILTWNTSTGGSVVDTRLWALYPPDPSHPLGAPVVLYEGFNAPSGGTSFLASYPKPCGFGWTLDVNSTSSLVVAASIALVYNGT